MEHMVSIVATAATPTAVIRETTTWGRFPTLWGELLGEVWGYVRGAHARTGVRWEVYDHWRDDPSSFETGGLLAPGALNL